MSDIDPHNSVPVDQPVVPVEASDAPPWYVKIPQYWKAITAFVGPVVVGLGAALTETSDGGTSITGAEWAGIVSTAVVTAGAVFFVSNKPKS